MIWTIRRRVRSRTRVVRAFLPFVAVVGFLFAVNVFMDAQTLTPAQEASAELGSDSAQVTLFEVELPAGTATGEELRDRVAHIDARVGMAINAIDFPYYAGDARGIYFREQDWHAQPPTDQYELLDGRWPERAGEIAIVGEQTRAAKVGDTVPTLGGGPALTVVGVGDPRWKGSPILLAAPGTWAALSPASEGKTQVTAFPTFELHRGAPTDLVGVVQTALASARVAPYSELGPSEVADRLTAKLRTRADAASEADRLWSARSPLSLRVPGLILVPATVVIGYLVLLRRFATAARRMVAQGLRPRDAVLALWLVPLPSLVLLACAGAVVGSLLGQLVAEAGVGRWGYFTANWRLPWESAIILAGGLVLAAGAALAVIRARVRGPKAAQTPRGEQVRRWAPLRQLLAGLVGAACLWLVLTIDSGADATLLTALGIVLAILLTPELVDAMARLTPTRTLTQRLVARQIQHNRSRIAVAATTYIALVGIAVGFVVVLASYSRQLLERNPSAPPPGQVLVDNDGTAFLPVDPGVRATLESQAAFSEQTPTQLYLIGTTVESEDGITEVRDAVGTPDFPAISFAFDTVDDVEVAYGRSLTDAERTMLESGGALVPQPDRVSTAGGEVQLVDINDLAPVAEMPALAAEPVPTPWADVPLVMLLETTEDRGLAHQPAALLYHGISAAEADRAEQALIESGYSPRTINKHERPPAVVPAAALLGSAVALLALVGALSVLVSRAQVQGMRPWASRLTQIGVRRQWASRALTHQYLWTLGLALPVGLLASFGALGVARLRLPDLELVVPWSQVAGIVMAIVLATAAGATLAARNLHTADDRET